MKVPFFRQESGVVEHDHIADVLDGENGDFVAKLEEEFETYIGASFAIATSSGTAALHLAMLALDLKRGDKVLCSVNAFPSVPEVVRHFDAEPTFIDIDPKTYNIDLNKLEKYHWPGNVRQLLNVIQRALILCDTDKIEEEHIIIEESNKVVEFDGTLRDFEKQLLLKRLEDCNGNRTQTASTLGVSVRWIQIKLKEMGLQ